MKILIAAPYIYKKEWTEFSSNPTGFGIMVYNIYKSIASIEKDTFLLTQVITKGHGKVLKHTWVDVFIHAKIKDWIRGLSNFIRYKQNIKNRCRYFYYGLNAGTLRKAIEYLQPDVVHIHGLEKPYLDVCQETGVPYVVTLHGLIGLDDSIHVPEWDKKLEKDFLIKTNKNRIPITVISTGMKKRIEEYYLGYKTDNITVVCNGTHIDGTENNQSEDCDLRSQYGLNTKDKIIVAIGSVCERKNQIQIVRAYLTGEIKTPCHIFLCGRDCTGGKVEKLINDNGLSNRIHVLGFIPHDRISWILEQADINVDASKDKGLDLSVIEAYSHGVPTVTFTDLEDVQDFYDENSMILVNERDDQAFGQAIELAMNHSWNKDEILKKMYQYSLDEVAKRYEKQYKKNIGQGKCMKISQTIDFIGIKRLMGYKVLTYVGNITDNKNQLVLAEALKSLTEEKVIAIFVGREADGGNVRRYIVENHLETQAFLCGFCNEMDSIWEKTDLNIFLSKNDGFGLPVIEGYSRGIPCVLNSALDAFEDLFNSNCAIAVPLEEDKISNSIIEALNIQWDNKMIQRFARTSSLENMAKKYIKVFYERIND